jgi:hypothetical protein
MGVASSTSRARSSTSFEWFSERIGPITRNGRSVRFGRPNGHGEGIYNLESDAEGQWNGHRSGKGIRCRYLPSPGTGCLDIRDVSCGVRTNFCKVICCAACRRQTSGFSSMTASGRTTPVTGQDEEFERRQRHQQGNANNCRDEEGYRYRRSDDSCLDIAGDGTDSSGDQVPDVYVPLLTPFNPRLYPERVFFEIGSAGMVWWHSPPARHRGRTKATDDPADRHDGT